MTEEKTTALRRPLRAEFRRQALGLLLLATTAIGACGGGGGDSPAADMPAAPTPPTSSAYKPNPTPTASATPLEDRYTLAGPQAVTIARSAGCCDAKGNAFDIYRPRDLGAAGAAPLPVVLWGNGSDATPDKYDAFLSHLASWGVVVVATRDTATGMGGTMLDALAFIEAESKKPDSPYHGRIDLGRVATAGHSQGAAGAINALAASAGRIRAALAADLPSQAICHGPYCLGIPLNLPSGSAVFFVSGEYDTLSPPTQASAGTDSAPYQSVQAYYDAVPAGILKVKGSVRGADHSDIQGQPGCVAGAYACRTGVQRFLGYPTAWLLWRLNGLADGPAVFGAASGEMTRQASAHWLLAQTNVP